MGPDWTIEILSPDQSQTKVTKNILHCLKHGTQIGWLINPEEKSVFGYGPTQSTEVAVLVLKIYQASCGFNLNSVKLRLQVKKILFHQASCNGT